jgi:protein-disulfide isomerase
MKNMERLLNVVLVVAAVAMAGAVVHRELKPAPAPKVRAVGPDVYHEDWKEFRHSGRLASGRKESPIQVIEFLDLECPACSQFQAKTVAGLKRAYGDSLAITVVHFPLNIHRFAQPAAAASECAAEQGRFSAFVDLAFARQDSFGLKPWPAYAAQAGVGDTAAFSRCLTHPKPSLVQAGESLAARLKVNRTPTLIVNGWEYSTPGTEKSLREDFDAILGKRPRRFDSAKSLGDAGR